MVHGVAGGLARWLQEDRLHHSEYRRRVQLGHGAGNVAQEVHFAALPGRTREHLGQRTAQPFVSVGDDQLHTAQPTSRQAAAELQPERLGLAGADRETEHALLAALAHAHRHHRGLADDPRTLTHLLVRRIEPDVRIRLIERSLTELGELLVEEGADPAHLAATDAAATQGGHEVIDLAGADPEHIGLLDHRQQRSVDASPRLEQGRKEAAGAQLRDLQLEASRAGVEDPLPVAVAVRGP